MRSYPPDSPQAAGRLLALMLIADDNVSAAEIGALKRLDAEHRLGLTEGELGVLLRDLCEDLMAAGNHAGSLLEGLDGATLRSMMEEVSDPRLRCEVLTLVQAAALADDHLTVGESFVMGAAYRHWSVSHSGLELQPAFAP